MIRIATWNVNSIRARQALVAAWLEQNRPDIVALQETKVIDADFPYEPFERLGYDIAVHGQKSYNGVALLSKSRLDVTCKALPGDDGDEQARYLEAETTVDGRLLRVASVYLPNGNPVGGDLIASKTEAFAYKLAWMARLTRHAEAALNDEIPIVLAGDCNVIVDERDVYDPASWQEDALYHPRIRRAFRSLLHLGYTDALRACDPASGVYTCWDYQRADWRHNRGFRIDHILLSPYAADALRAAGVDRTPRGEARPSDHTPVWIAMDLRRSARGG